MAFIRQGSGSHYKFSGFPGGGSIGTPGYTGGGTGAFQPMPLPVGNPTNPAYNAAINRVQQLNQNNYAKYIQNYGLTPAQIAARDQQFASMTPRMQRLTNRGLNRNFNYKPGYRDPNYSRTPHPGYQVTTNLGETPPGQVQPQEPPRDLGGGYTATPFNLPVIPGGGGGGFSGGAGSSWVNNAQTGGGAAGWGQTHGLFPKGSPLNKSVSKPSSAKLGRGGGRLGEIAASGEEQRKGNQQSFEHDTALAGQRYAHETGLLGTKADLNRQLADQAYEQNVGMLGLSTDANKELGTHQADLQRGLTRDAAALNLQAAREQAQLGRGTMDWQAELQRRAAVDTARLNRYNQAYAAGLTEDAAQSTFDRNLAMQQATHGLNLDTMGQAQALNQLSAQQAQDRGFAGADLAYQKMFGGADGGMFGQIMDRFGGGVQPQAAGANPQFGGMGNFAQTPAGQVAAYNYANNPFSGAMSHMSQQPGGAPPGATSGQGFASANAAMMADATNAANAGVLAGQADAAAHQNAMGTMGAMAAAGQNAAGIAAQQAAPGLTAQAGLQAGAIQSLGNMFGGFA